MDYLYEYEDYANENLTNFCNRMMIANEAKFSYLPKFKKDPILKKYAKDVEQAELLLTEKGKDPGTLVVKILNMIIRFCDIYLSVIDVIAVGPLTLSIVGIPAYLINRLYSFGLNILQEKLTKAQAMKVIAKLSACKAKAKNPKEAEKFDKSIKKMKKIVAKL